MAEPLQFVCFRVGSQQFAVEIHRVIEVLAYRDVTPLPGAARFVEGVIDLRGVVIPVIDMRKRLGSPIQQNSLQTRILIVRIHRQKVGLIVDEADQVHTVPVENIQSPPDQGSDLILAIARHENSIFVILDLEKVLSGGEGTRLLAVTDGTAQPDLQQ